MLQILRGEQSSPNLCVILNTWVEVIKLLRLGSISLMLYKIQLPTCYKDCYVHADVYGKASLQYEVTQFINVDGIPYFLRTKVLNFKFPSFSYWNEYGIKLVLGLILETR